MQKLILKKTVYFCEVEVPLASIRDFELVIDQNLRLETSNPSLNLGRINEDGSHFKKVNRQRA